MDLIVQCAGVYTRAVRAPAYRRNWTPKLKHAHRCLRSLVAPLPNSHGPVISAGHDKLDAGSSCQSSVEGINDSAVRVEFTHTLASREVRNAERVVGGDRI